MQDASGLLYLRARYLSTSTGRFTSVDPFSGYMNYPASMNPYQYAYNNPLRYVDPSGESVIGALALGTAGSAVLGGAFGAGGSIISQLIANGGNWNCIDWGEVGRSALVGAIGGAVGFLAATAIALSNVGLALTIVLTVIADVAIGELTYAVDQKLHGEDYEFSWGRIAQNAAISVLTLGAGHGLGKLWNKTKNGKAFQFIRDYAKKLADKGVGKSFIKKISGYLLSCKVVVLGFKADGSDTRMVFQKKGLFDFLRETAGVTNLDRMAPPYIGHGPKPKAKAPIGIDGLVVQLHHLLQEEPGPMVEILTTTHRGYSSDLHVFRGKGESFRNNPALKTQYDQFRENYWNLIGNQFKSALK